MIDGCPILRVLCEGWDSQISPFNLPRKADLFLGRPGCSATHHLRGETQVTRASWPPTQSLEVAAFVFRCELVSPQCGRKP
jgi:hypothetical protein